MRNYRFALPVLALALLLTQDFKQPGSFVVAAAGRSDSHSAPANSAAPFQIKSPAFEYGGQIDRQYTCDGANLSPALQWNSPPAGTQSLALIADDPDAPSRPWTHWILWNLPARSHALPEGVPLVNELGDKTIQGKNDFKRIGYAGPCPPPGHPHRYFFKLYALNATLDLQSGSNRYELETAMKPHLLAQSQWMGTYKR